MMWQNAGRSGIDQWNFVMSPENASQDPTGRYTRKYVPELAKLPNKLLHKPWLATPRELAEAGVELGGGQTGGGSYPLRVVTDLKAERAASVAAVLEMRRAHQDLNDARGYDLITLPGRTTKVFTKEEFRISKSGDVLPPPPRRKGGKGAGGKRSASSGSRGRAAEGQPSTKSRGGGRLASGSHGKPRGQPSVADFFKGRPKAGGAAAVASIVQAPDRQYN
jgi:hypothetical protein